MCWLFSSLSFLRPPFFLALAYAVCQLSIRASPTLQHGVLPPSPQRPRPLLVLYVTVNGSSVARQTVLQEIQRFRLTKVGGSGQECVVMLWDGGLLCKTSKNYEGRREMPVHQTRPSIVLQQVD